MTDTERSQTSEALKNLAVAYGLVDKACIRYGLMEADGVDAPAGHVTDCFVAVRTALDAAREPILAMVSHDLVRLNETIDRVQEELAHG